MKISVAIAFGLIVAVAVSALPASPAKETPAGCPPPRCGPKFKDSDGKCYRTCCFCGDCGEGEVPC
ncbi:hypothetical protein GQ42DRAFT_164481 [Ramicandelaber brevisporus]|nr:hypothetical protein GQ42DRAFT_164481 [Ramicandelaber brevisporus]